MDSCDGTGRSRKYGAINKEWIVGLSVRID